MLQSVMFDSNTLLIELHPERAAECIDCSACLRVCPTRMDIRKGFDQACINCAQCIDACNKVMAPMKKKGLIGYAFGAADRGRIFRKSSLVLAALTLLFALLFGYLVAARTGVDVVVLPSRIQPRITREQMVLNAYVLSVKNSLDVPLNLVLKVEAPGASPVQSLTAPIHLDADRSEYLPLFVRIEKTGAMKTVRLKLTFTDAANHIEIKREANFVIPNEL
jgi:polyferredoxin